MAENPDNTHLTLTPNGEVMRHYTDIADAMPEWIGDIATDGQGRKWFYAYGDNRVFRHNELKQLMEWTA